MADDTTKAAASHRNSSSYYRAEVGEGFLYGPAQLNTEIRSGDASYGPDWLNTIFCHVCYELGIAYEGKVLSETG